MKSKLGTMCAAACVLATASLCGTARADSSPAPAPDPKETQAARANDSLRVGVLGGVGFPRPLAVEGVLVFDKLVLLGAEYSALPTTSFSGVQTSLWALSADARVFPFRNGFFVGLRAGKQHLDESASVTVSGIAFSGSSTADTTFLNPRMGFLWTWGPVALGIDAGVQIPVATSTSTSLPPGVTAPQSVTDVNHMLSEQAIPTIDLLRLGIVM